MKKFLAILTIVAMLSSMVVIGASADGAYAIDMDFTDYAGSTTGKHQNQNLNTNANAVAYATNELGVYPVGNGAVSGDSALVGVDGAMQTKGFWIYVPEFFNGKSAGTYTVEFDYSSPSGSLYGYRLDVGGTLNNHIASNSAWSGNAAFVTGKEGYNQYGIAVFGGASSTGHAALTFDWDGTLTQPSAAGVGNLKVANYDLESLCIKIVASDSSVFLVDNLKVSNILEPVEAALESTVAPLVIEDAYTEDFTGYTAVGEATPVADSRWNSIVADASLYNKDVPAGIYAHGYTSPAAEARRFAKVNKSENDTAIEAPGFYIKVPEFFKDKQAGGTFTVSFDAKAIGHTSTLYVRQYIPGATCNAYGNGVYFKNEAGFSNYGWKAFSGGNTSDWTHASVTIEYTGACVVDVTNAGDSAKTDKYALCLLVSPGQDTPDGTKKYYFDNITVTPVDNSTGTVVDYANKSMVVNNTVYVNNGAALNAEVISAAYDQNGNLRAVGTAPVAIDAGEASKAADVTIEEIPAGITANWTFKSFLWSDLDNEIEPLYDVVNPFDANIKQSIGVEFNPVTSVPDDYTTGTYTMAKDWVSNGAYCLTDYALNGRYSIYIPQDKSAYLADDGFLAANGEGTYTVRVWYSGATLITRLHKDGMLHRHGATSPGGGYEAYSGSPTQVKENGDVVTKTVNGKTYYLHEAVLDTTKLYGDSKAEPQGFRFGAYNADAWVEVESIVFTPAQ